MATEQLGIVLRPKSFDDVIDQDAAVEAMKGWCDSGKAPRAVMLVGPAGTGKTTLAKIFARAVQGWELASDETFEPDVIEINAADQTGIDEMRSLLESIQSYPMMGKYRVVILDEAHMLSKPTQNLLLKPFEDPNARNIYFICTTETAKIIPALVTRCQRFDLKRLSKEGIHTLLVRAADHTGTEDFNEFETIAIREKLNQPRALLNAFGNYVSGTPAHEAINAQLNTFSANVFDIAQAVVYGDWNKSVKIWNGKVECKPVKQLFAELEDAFKKKKKGEEAKDDDSNDDATDAAGAKDDTAGRPEVSRGIRAITGSLLKGMVIREGSTVAAECISMLAQFGAPPGAFDAPLEYPCTVAILLRINTKLRQAK